MTEFSQTEWRNILFNATGDIDNTFSIKTLSHSKAKHFSNPNSKFLDKQPPLIYSEMLDYFKELCTGHPDVYRNEFIIWNNKKITIENKSIFLAHLFEKGICFV